MKLFTLPVFHLKRNVISNCFEVFNQVLNIVLFSILYFRICYSTIKEIINAMLNLSL
jgi:hypothetical protein